LSDNSSAMRAKASARKGDRKLADIGAGLV
jgi:hypothetical protein